VLHFALHYAIRRKALLHKYLQQILPALVAISPYATIVYV
jgi:hypothetical protein